MLGVNKIPKGVILTSIFLIINGLILVIFSSQIIINRSFSEWTMFLAWHSMVQLTFHIPIDTIQTPDPWYVSIMDFGVGIQFLILLIGIINFLGVLGVFLLKKWARNIILILMLVNVFSIIPLTVRLIEVLPYLWILQSLISGGIPIISALIIRYLCRPDVKKFFYTKS